MLKIRIFSKGAIEVHQVQVNSINYMTTADEKMSHRRTVTASEECTDMPCKIPKKIQVPYTDIFR